MLKRAGFMVFCIGLWLGLGVGGLPKPDLSLPVQSGKPARGPSPTMLEPDFVSSVAFNPPFSGCGGEQVPVMQESFEQEVVDLVNQERASHGLPPLKQVEELSRAARYHAADMAFDDYFQHDTYDRVNGNLVKYCNWMERIAVYYPYNYIALGENIAAGPHTPQNVFHGWMNSTTHRTNILSANFYEIGVGYYLIEGEYTPYWVQDFGRSRERYPLLIQQDAAITYQPEVNLFIYGDWQEMRLRNDSSAWADWQPFQSSFAWSLERVAGERSVTAELRSGRITHLTSDTILLEQLNGLSEELHFYYSTEDQSVHPDFYTLLPELNGSDSDFSWQLSQEGEWFQVAPNQGDFQQALTVTPGSLSSLQPGVYFGEVILTVTYPLGVINSPYTIKTFLYINDPSFQSIFLPLLIREQW
jgi:uncharacterized protein YkwD